MEKSELVTAIADRSDLSLAEAASAVEFVFRVMSAERRPASPDMPSAANANRPLLQQLVLFDEQGGSRTG